MKSPLRLEFAPFPMGQYEKHDPLDVCSQVDHLRVALEEFEPHEIGWHVDMRDRGGDAVTARLIEWSATNHPKNSFLYWVGHGWSDGDDAALAHAKSEASVRTSGILPEQIAEPIRSHQLSSQQVWAIVVIDTCWSARFVDRVNAALAASPIGADRVLLVGVSGDGATAIGRFSQAFSSCLRDNFRSNRGIELWQLARELERRLPESRIVPRRLGEAALRRRQAPLSAHITAPLDVLQDLERCLDSLARDEREHFLAMASGADDGEISWFFEGRDHERQSIFHWLRSSPGGLLIVTGAPGIGKSALLGNILMHSRSELKRALTAGGLLANVETEEEPPQDVFDEVIHLTGLTLADVVRRLAKALQLGRVPSETDTRESTSLDVDWLVSRLRARGQSTTILADALDEAVEPLVLARTLFRRIAYVPGMRLVLGTRPSTAADLDGPRPEDSNLLDALGATDQTLLELDRDPEGVLKYVGNRLAAALQSGKLRNTRREPYKGDIERAASEIAVRHRDYLFARLAVHELIADPTLLDPGRTHSLELLLRDGQHDGLFRAAVDRVQRLADAHAPLLECLALARGRGLPIQGGVWASLANPGAAITVGRDLGDDDVSQLLRDAQAYVAADLEDGQTVYRLAHRAFVEYFLRGWEAS